MRKSLVALVAVVTVATAACGADSPPPPMEKGGCGMAAYEWLPTEQVGGVVTSRESERSMFSGMTLDVMLAAAGAGEFFSPVAYGARLHHLRYTTQDRGQLVEATGLVAVPWVDGARRERHPVVLFLHGTSGFMGECAPSYSLDDGSIFPLLLLAAQGYIVVAPDYIGMDADADFTKPPAVKHAYLGLEQTALGSLDMVRAARAMFKAQGAALNADFGDDLVIWGGSQGGHAAFASDLVAPYYAPELKVRANVALIPPTDLKGIATYAVGSVNDATGAFAAALTGFHYWHQGTATFDTLLTTTDPWNLATTVPEAMYAGCEADDRFDGITQVSEVYQPTVIEQGLAGDWDTLEPWGCYLRVNSITWSPVARLRTTPTLFVVSQNDKLVYAPAEREDFPRLCGLGYDLEYLECADAEHSDGALWSLPEQIAWVKERLAGKPIAAADRCVIKPAVRCSGQPEN